MHGFLISFTAPRIFPRSPDLPAGRVPGRLHAALPRPRSCCLVPAARRARKKPIRKATEKSNGRVFRTHAHYDVEQIAASVPLICPRHAAFIGFRNFICSYICRPCAPRMPHGFIIGRVGFVPALRIPPCPVLSSGAPVGRRPCAPKKHVFRI